MPRPASPFAPSRPLPARARVGGGAGLIVFYLVFATLYAGTIAYSVQAEQPGAFPEYLRRTLLYDYTLKARWTVPVWWLLFRTPLDRGRVVGQARGAPGAGAAVGGGVVWQLLRSAVRPRRCGPRWS